MVTTTPEQSKHLIELGLYLETASACWRSAKEDRPPYDLITRPYEEWLTGWNKLNPDGFWIVFPAWTFDDLM